MDQSATTAVFVVIVRDAIYRPKTLGSILGMREQSEYINILVI